jgi:hypothetical protein
MFEQQAHGYFQPVGASWAPAGTIKSAATRVIDAIERIVFSELSMTFSFVVVAPPESLHPCCVV